MKIYYTIIYNTSIKDYLIINTQNLLESKNMKMLILKIFLTFIFIILIYFFSAPNTNTKGKSLEEIETTLPILSGVINYPASNQQTQESQTKHSL